MRPEIDCVLDRFHEWLAGLPWVVERPQCRDAPDVRMFAVECDPIGRRQMWLITGVRRPALVGASGIAVVLPLAAADLVEAAGWGRRTEPVSSRHVLVAASGDASLRPREVEALVLAAYSYAMS